jgi:hypothetical protein
VLAEIAQGKSNAAIAESLVLTKHLGPALLRELWAEHGN